MNIAPALTAWIRSKWSTGWSKLDRFLFGDVSESDNNGSEDYSKIRFTNFEIIILVGMVGFYLNEIIRDTNAVTTFYNKEQVFYCVFTVVCISLPALITCVLNACRYGYIECLKNTSSSPEQEPAPVPKWLRVFRFTLTIVFPLSAMPSFADNLYFGMKYRKAKRSRNIEDMKTYFTALHGARGSVALNNARKAILKTGPQMLLTKYWSEPYLIIGWDLVVQTGILLMIPIIFGLSLPFASWRFYLMTIDSKQDYAEAFIKTHDSKKLPYFFWIVFATALIVSRSLIIHNFTDCYAGWTVTLCVIFVHILIVFILMHCAVEREIEINHVINGKYVKEILSPVQRFVVLLSAAIASVYGCLIHNNNRFSLINYYYWIYFAEHAIFVVLCCVTPPICAELKDAWYVPIIFLVVLSVSNFACLIWATKCEKFLKMKSFIAVV